MGLLPNEQPRTAQRTLLHEMALPFLLALLLLSATALSHLGALDSWWLIDDPQVLLHAIRNSPAETLFDPDAWRTLSSSNFTPLVTLSFDLDLLLFGPEPLLFYQHQIASIAIAALAIFLLLEPVCGRILAWLTAAAVGAGPAMALASESLMIRHYVEGLALAAAALLVWRSADPDRPTLPRDAAAAALYLLAMLAKEVYAPLPLFFVADALVRRVPPRRLLARIAPSAVVALVYSVWRTWMLGSGGGYGSPAMPGAGYFFHVYQAIFASAPVWAFLALPVLAIVAGVAAFRGAPRESAIILGAGAIFLILPLIPVAGVVEARYGFLPAVVGMVLIGIGLSRLQPRVAISLGAALVVVAIAGGWAHHRNADRQNRQMIAEGRYVRSAPENAPPLLAGSPGWYLGGLADLRALEGARAPEFLLSMEALIVGAVEPEAAVRVEMPGGVVRHIDPDTLQRVFEQQALADPSIPIALEVTMEDSVIRWNVVGEAAERIWLTVPGYDEYTIPPEGARRIPRPTAPGKFRLLVRLGDGRWNVTPALPLPEEGETVRWRSEVPIREAA